MPDRLVGPVGVDGIGILAVGQSRQMSPAGFAETAHHRVERQCRQVPHRAHAQIMQACRRCGTDTPQCLDGVAVEEAELVGRLHEEHAGARLEPSSARPGLAAREASLAIILERPIPTAHSEMQFVVYSAAQSVRDVLWWPEQAHRARDVDERLVETDRLDHRRDVGEDLVQLPADLRVPALATGQEDGLGAELAARTDGMAECTPYLRAS